MLPRDNHPCLTCPLPDCDDTSPRCPLRSALRTYYRALKAKTPLPKEMQVTRAIAYHEFYGCARDNSRRGIRSAGKAVSA